MFKDRTLAIFLLIVATIGIVLSFFSPSAQSEGDAKKGLGGSTLKSLSGVGGDKILSLELSGVLMDGSLQSFLGEEHSSAVKVRDQLIKAAKDSSVKGVLLRINSPGGAVGISQELYEAVKLVRKQKPVIASMGDIAASGGYYTAAPCDYIYANPGTLTGSIGVISHFTNIQGLYDKVGLKDMTVKAGLFKDIGSSTRPMTAEEKEILQALVDDTYEQFLEDVYLGRRTNDAKKYGEQRKNLTRNMIRELAQGMIYTGRQAQAMGLVDKLGGYNDALKALQKLAKQRSNGRIKDDLEVIDSLGGSYSIKDLISLRSGGLDMQAFRNLLLGSLIGNNSLTTMTSSQIKVKPSILLIAPELISN
jgi:protease-4